MQNVAKRPGLVEMLEQVRPRSRVQCPREPLLEELAGMTEAREWGLSLAHDLAAYQDGLLPWKDVDPGALIYGPPGTGKTTFAKALAATCDIGIIATSYTQWQRAGDGHMGDVMEAMRADFEEAAQAAPCILFIDELDSIPKRRSGARNENWNTAINNALLEHLDGFERRTGVIVLAACNDPSVLDPAILRAGRLDRRICIPLPGHAELRDILAFHLGEDANSLGDLQPLAVLCSGRSGADVAKLVREARRKARREQRALTTLDLRTTLDAGMDVLAPDLLHRIAIHEAGHGVAFLREAKASDITLSLLAKAESGFGGQTAVHASAPEARTRTQWENEITAVLAGRAAEEIILRSISSGSGGSEGCDLFHATRMAINLVTCYGLASTGSLMWSEPHESASNSLLHPPAVTSEVNDLLTACYARSCAVIRKHRRAVIAVAESLIEKRALIHSDLEAIVSAHTKTRRKSG